MDTPHEHSRHLDADAQTAHQSSAENVPFTYLGKASKAERLPFSANLASEQTSLMGMIAGEMLPRLMLVYSGGVRTSPQGAPFVRQFDQTRFAEALLGGNTDEQLRIIAGLEERGVNRDFLLVDLFGYAARDLGAKWESDEVSFVDVSVGLCQLHKLMRETSGASVARLGNGIGSHGVGVGDTAKLHTGGPSNSVLVCTFGDTSHVLGASIVSEIFREKGWRVHNMVSFNEKEVATALKRRSVDCLAISVSSAFKAEKLANYIAAARKASKNKDMKVIIGGLALGDRPITGNDLVGADLHVLDARAAPQAVGKLVAAVSSR